MAEATVEEVQRRLEAKRERLADDRSPANEDEGTAHETTEHQCPSGCGNIVERATLRPFEGGKPLALPPPLCQECQDQVEREEEEREARKRAEAKDHRRKYMGSILAGLGVNVREHGEVGLGEWDDSDAGPEPLEAAREFIDAVREASDFDPVRGLYLWGKTGNGKSQLAVAIVQELLLDPSRSPDRIVYDRADSLITEVQDTYGSDVRTGDVIDRRLEATVWVLDDLGAEKVSDDVAQVLTQIISRRACWPNVITSNLSPEEYESRHDGLARVGSRLGPRYFRTIEVKGRDRRFDDAPTGQPLGWEGTEPVS